MTGIIVADTGPLIALGRAGYLQLLQELYQEIFIHPAVHTELCLGSGRPGSKQLSCTMEQGWLQIKKPSDSTASSLSELLLILDLGEAEAIVLAEEVDCRFLLIDEREGRAVAKRRGVPVAGIASVSLAAKKHGFVDEVTPIVKRLEDVGYRLSVALTSWFNGGSRPTSQNRLITLPGVVGPVNRHLSYITHQLIKHDWQVRAVVNVARGQTGGGDRLLFPVHPDMELSPGTAVTAAHTVLADILFTCTEHLQPGGIDYHVLHPLCSV